MPTASAAARACGATSWRASTATAAICPGSILGLDITGDDVEETGLVWEDGDADRACWPIPGTLVRSPWQVPAAGQLLVSMYELDGTPSPGDPRHALKRVVDRFAELNLTPVIAIELEFYLLDRTRGDSGRAAPAGLAGERLPAEPAPGLSADRSRRSRAVPGRSLRRLRGAGPAGADADLRIRAGPARDRAAPPRRRPARRRRGHHVQARSCAASPPGTAWTPPSWPSPSPATPAAACTCM